MANAGVRGRPIEPLVLSPQERAYLERRVTALPGRYLSDADGISLLTHLGLQAVGRGQDAADAPRRSSSPSSRSRWRSPPRGPEHCLASGAFRIRFPDGLKPIFVRAETPLLVVF